MGPKMLDELALNLVEETCIAVEVIKISDQFELLEEF